MESDEKTPPAKDELKTTKKKMRKVFKSFPSELRSEEENEITEHHFK